MYLKRLTLHGFKSFATRTVLEFSPGLTAIIGANGSGKSNIADALRWVLGEQSVRQLRGRKGDDVIFAGSNNRGAAQMAEVGLVLDNSSGWLPSEFSEVTVARRSFRSGETEYLINGQRVRLRDVLLLLAQARIGHDSYTVIGQGLIDQALSARPEERRALFEDAAGIRQFQVQRTDAEQKLNLTQTNLSRLRDIIGEIEPRLAPLAEQARRAKDYLTARDELARLLTQWFRYQVAAARLAVTTAEAVEVIAQVKLGDIRMSLETHEQRTADLRAQRETLTQAIVTLRRERGEVSARLQTAERDLAVGQERHAALERQRADVASEQSQQEAEASSARAEAERLEAHIAATEARAEEAAQALQALESGQASARREQETAEAQLRTAQRDVIQAQARLGTAQGELGRMQRQLGDRNRALAARQDATRITQDKLDTIEAQLAVRQADLGTRRAKAEHLAMRDAELQVALSTAQTDVERLSSLLAEHEREAATLRERLTLLESWRASREGFSAGARALLDAHDPALPPLLGVLVEMIAVPPGYEAAIEAALRESLQAVVLGTRADAFKAAQWLAAAGAERAMLLWLGEPEPPRRQPAEVSVDGTDVIALARAVVRCGREMRPLIDALLGDTAIVRTLAVARDRLDGKVPCVTRDGEAFAPEGWLKAGSVQKGGHETGLLAREHMLRDLPQQLDRLEQVIADLQAEHQSVLARRETLTAERKEVATETRRLESILQGEERELAALLRERDRAASETSLVGSVSEQLATEVEALEREVAAMATRAAEHEEAQRLATEQVEDAQLTVDELLDRNRSQQDELAKARTAQALAQQESRTLATQADQLHAQAEAIEAQMARRTERLEALARSQAELLAGLQAHQQDIDTLRATAAVLRDKMLVLDVDQAEIERALTEGEKAVSGLRQDLGRLEEEYRRALLEAQRARDGLEALRAQIAEEAGEEDGELTALLRDDQDGDSDGTAESAKEPAEAVPELTADEAAKMRRQIDTLRSRLRNIGGYDPEAPQAYEELKTRFDFLSSQMRDMEQASANLRTIINELDTTMRRQFEETFRAVNERFQVFFTQLFIGGSARLELTAPRRDAARDAAEEDDAPEEPRGVPRKVSFGGVEVYVQIPGKKVEDLTLLSGGERALVSAALLFALLESNPPPFCLLDEVDAALDAANVVRFCAILRQLTERTQFLVITHNQVTMSHADALYGVSMQAESVSRIASMRLEEIPSGSR